MVRKHQLVVVGDGGVGKTSIVVRYVDGSFSEITPTTLVDIHMTKIKLDDDTTIQVEIADTAGQEDFHALREKAISGVNVFLVVFSVTEMRSLHMAEQLLEQISYLNRKNGFNFILIGNKCDCAKELRQVTIQDGRRVAKRFNGKFMEASAETKVGVDEVFKEIGKMFALIDGPFNVADDSNDCNCLIA